MRDKHRKFIIEYVKDQNATQAAIRAGYSSRSATIAGTRLMRNVNVRSEIEKLMADAAERCGITVEFILNGLREVAERCMQGKERLAKDGTPLGVWQFDSAGANRAMELLGRYKGMFVDKHEVTGKDGGAIIINYPDAKH